jgi:hypothetical protein
VPGYVGTAGRGDFNAQVNLPSGSSNGKAVLSAVGVDFQDAVDYGQCVTDSVDVRDR